MENFKNLIELISAGTVIVGTIVIAVKAVGFFNYKYDSDIRNLYIENCKKIRAIMGKIISAGEAENSDIYSAQVLLQDALIFLHKDVANYLKEVCDAIVVLTCYKVDLATHNLPEDKRQEYIDKNEDALNKILDLNKQSFLIYRKHIVKDGLGFDKFKKILDYKHDKKQLGKGK